jgi:hypothetical protein
LAGSGDWKKRREEGEEVEEFFFLSFSIFDFRSLLSLSLSSLASFPLSQLLLVLVHQEGILMLSPLVGTERTNVLFPPKQQNGSKKRSERANADEDGDDAIAR